MQVKVVPPQAEMEELVGINPDAQRGTSELLRAHKGVVEVVSVDDDDDDPLPTLNMHVPLAAASMPRAAHEEMADSVAIIVDKATLVLF